MADTESVSWIFLQNSAKKLTLPQPLSDNNSAITYLINPAMSYLITLQQKISVIMKLKLSRN